MIKNLSILLVIIALPSITYCAISSLASQTLRSFDVGCTFGSRVSTLEDEDFIPEVDNSTELEDLELENARLDLMINAWEYVLVLTTLQNPIEKIRRDRNRYSAQFWYEVRLIVEESRMLFSNRYSAVHNQVASHLHSDITTQANISNELFTFSLTMLTFGIYLVYRLFLKNESDD